MSDQKIGGKRFYYVTGDRMPCLNIFGGVWVSRIVGHEFLLRFLFAKFADNKPVRLIERYNAVNIF